MPASALAEFIDELVYQLLLTNRVLSRNLAISNCNFRALVFVRHNDGASVRELAMFLGVTLPRASNVVDGLVKRELMRREVSQDRRRASLRLTDDGANIADSLRAIHTEVAKRILSQIPTSNQTNLREVAEQCTAALRTQVI